MQVNAEALFLIQAIILIAGPLFLWRIGWIQKVAPLVVIQILLGIILGPSVFGQLLPKAYQWFFPAESLAVLNGIAWLGLCLFAFLTGLHFDLKVVFKRGTAFVATSLSTLLVPLILGTGLAIAFYKQPFIDENVNIFAFVIGVGIAIAVTALPVLSAILMELKLIDKPLGERVIGYAAVNDIALWIALAGVIALTSGTNSGNVFNEIFRTIFLSGVFLAVMQWVIRPLCRYLASNAKLTAAPSSIQLAMVTGGVLLSALATELIGLHFVFGAFILGAMMPAEVKHGLYNIFEQFTMVALMPFYFMLTGLKTSFSFDSSATWLLFGCATVVAVFGKIAGTALPEILLHKTPKRIALKAGILMQTKGLMEIVVLNILLAEGIINSMVFSALVLMAVVTTLLTKPSILLSSYIFRHMKSHRVSYS